MSKAKQKTFNTIARHLLAQKRKSMTPMEDCRYRMELRSDKVLKCAIGCLIPDDKYRPSLEGKAVTNPEVRLAIPREHRWVPTDPKSDQRQMMLALQQLHDLKHPGTWTLGLALVAKAFGLRTDQVDGLPGLDYHKEVTTKSLEILACDISIYYKIGGNPNWRNV